MFISVVVNEIATVFPADEPVVVRIASFESLLAVKIFASQPSRDTPDIKSGIKHL